MGNGENAGKVDIYFEFIDDHVVKAIGDKGVGDASCFASVLLLCGAIDGLGGLVHDDDDASARDRLREFLKRMPAKYSQHEAGLWKLRNSLAHEAVNAGVFLSSAGDAGVGHLEEVALEDGQTYLFVHIRALLEDFCKAKADLRREIETSPKLTARAGGRLIDTKVEYRLPEEYGPDKVRVTEPGPVRLVVQKRRRRRISCSKCGAPVETCPHCGQPLDGQD